MSDFLLFFIGCFVSLVVLSAVGLLMWGAAREPRGTLLPRRVVQSRTSPEPARVRTARETERLAG